MALQSFVNGARSDTSFVTKEGIWVYAVTLYRIRCTARILLLC